MIFFILLINSKFLKLLIFFIIAINIIKMHIFYNNNLAIIRIIYLILIRAIIANINTLIRLFV